MLSRRSGLGSRRSCKCLSTCSSTGQPRCLSTLISQDSAGPKKPGQVNVYDNALAESVIGLFKTEVIQRKGPWRSLEAVEFATLVWVNWFNNRRLLGPIGDIPPAEFEAL